MKNLLLFSLMTMLFVSAKTTAQTSPPLYGASPFSDSLWTIDTTTFIATSSVLLVDTLTGTAAITGVNGLAVQPCTGDYYLIYKIAGIAGRLLGTVNPADGVVTQIGNAGDNIAGISFLDETTLYAQTGDGANTSEELYTLDINTAALTPVSNSGSGNDGETICFNPDDGLFYHWSGLGTPNIDEVLESFNSTTLAYTAITLSLHDPSEIIGSVYIGNNNFLINDANGDFYNVNATTGAVDSTGLGNSPDGNGLKGMAFPLRYVWYEQANTDTICSGDSTLMLASAGATAYQWYQDGVAISGATNNSFFANTSGSYKCEITHGTCVGFSDDSLMIVENPSPTISGVVTDVTGGNDGAIDATFTGTPTLTFDWDNDGTGDFDDTEDLSSLAPGTYTVVVMGGNGCTATSQFVVGSVGLNEFGLNASMSIFPNPNDGKFTVSFTEMNTEKVSVQIINTLGQVVSEGGVVNNSLEVDIRNSGAGIYMIRITDGIHSATRQIIVE